MGGLEVPDLRPTENITTKKKMDFREKQRTNVFFLQKISIFSGKSGGSRFAQFLQKQ